MVDLKEAVMPDCGRVVGSLSPREVAGAFSFSALPVMNTIVVDDFKQERKTQTYIITYHHASGCDPIYEIVRWWLEF